MAIALFCLAFFAATIVGSLLGQWIGGKLLGRWLVRNPEARDFATKGRH